VPDDKLEGELNWQPLDALRDPLLTGPVANFHYRAVGWTATGTVSRTDQGLTISRLEIDPDEDGAGVTITLMRSFPVRGILSRAHGFQQSVFMHPSNRELQEKRDVPLTKPGPGRAPLTDEFLREVALAYLEETAPGKPRGAVGRLVKRYSKPTPTVSRWIGRARDAGWLGAAAPGRAGAEPGPRLIAEQRSFRQRNVGGHPRPQSLKQDEQGEK
jgi:hypothetical protein